MTEWQTLHLLTFILNKPLNVFRLFVATIFAVTFRVKFVVIKTSVFTAPMDVKKRVFDLEVDIGGRVCQILYFRLKFNILDIILRLAEEMSTLA